MWMIPFILLYWMIGNEEKANWSGDWHLLGMQGMLGTLKHVISVNLKIILWTRN